jgi:FAD/FMN-containing dehydrogenase
MDERTINQAAAVTTTGTVVNDVHSQLNSTRVRRVLRPDSVASVQAALADAAAAGESVSIMGGGHAMGGQQFGTDTVLLDMRAMDQVIAFDDERGVVQVGSGIEWPKLIGWLIDQQRDRPHPWGIVQKQTGADRLTIGGALSANVHGRGLARKPMVEDVEAFELVDAAGTVRLCSRTENAELFRLAIGGYGLFGVISAVHLRLTPRRKLERVVQLLDVDEVMPSFAERIADGFVFGDFQASIDTSGDDFLRRGVFSCYRPVADSTPVPEERKRLSADDWKMLLYLAHVDKRRAVDTYEQYYLTTSGQVYWSDTHQLADYLDNYHAWVDGRPGVGPKGTEMITEIYVPHEQLVGFLEECRQDFRDHDVNAIYTTVRLVERDDETFLPWAKRRYVGIIFNIHTVHSPDGVERAGRAFRQLIDRGLSRGGNYYLTYHRFATRAQLEAGYPQFSELLRLKRAFDPEERFQSDWYRHYRAMFAEIAGRP